MTQQIKNAALAAAWFIYAVFLGPFLISSHHSLFVLMGVGLFVALIFAAYRLIRSGFGFKNNA